MRKRLFYKIMLFNLILQIAVIADTTQVHSTQNPEAPFRLFPTTNIWTFIKLDTRDGRIWQVQFDIQGDDRFTSVLNYQPLTTQKNSIPGRFTLYPTSNIYTFILLDQIDGRTWQMQWSFDLEKRFIIPIE